MDKRLAVCNTQEYDGFLPCPFCGSTNQTVRENRCSWLSEPIVFTVALCCNRCGLEIPIDVEFDELPNGRWEEMIRDRIDDIRQRWNTRWRDEEWVIRR